MSDTASLSLSNYQRAILHKMGVCHWLLNTTAKDRPITEEVIESNQKISQVQLRATKEEALSKLADLKGTVKPVKTTDKVLLTLTVPDEKSRFLQDVLLAIGGLDVASVTAQQLEEYQGAPLIWKKGPDINMQSNCLYTPEIDVLLQPSGKKLLWKTLQSYIANLPT